MQQNRRLLRCISWLALFLPALATAQNNVLPGILTHGSSRFRQVIQQADAHRLQIVFTQINRDRRNRPILIHHHYRLNNQAHFNPASTVKLPAAIAALQRLHSLDQRNLSPDTRLSFGPTICAGADSIPVGQRTYPTLGRAIDLALAISDNPAYNRLYTFAGPERITTLVQQYAAQGIVNRRFDGCNATTDLETGYVNFWSDDGRTLLHHLPGATAPATLLNEQGNQVPLFGLHQMLAALVLPDAFPDNEQLDLQDDDRQRLLRALSSLPSELPYTINRKYYHDARLKYLLYGTNPRAYAQYPASRYRVFNKVGLVGGWLTDVAYVVDYDTGTEFLLSATLYVGHRGRRGVEQVGMPFLAELGRLVLRHEQQRRKSNRPNLDDLRLDYHQDGSITTR